MMEYKRLTSKDKNGFYHYNCTKKEKKDCSLWESCGECYGSKVLRKLGELEDDLESGKIVRLPCKVGDTMDKKKKRDVVKKIYKISKLVLSITDEEFEELETMAQEQCDYFNPLNCATTAMQHALGSHNKRMIKCLRELNAVDKELQNG